MTDLPPLDRDQEDEALAAEVALGVLDGEERAAALRRVARDPAFAARVVAWEARLSPMADDVPPVPAPNLLPKIEARLFPVAEKERRFRIGAMIGAGFASLAMVLLAVAFYWITPAPTVMVHMQTADASTAYDATFDGTRVTVRRMAGQAAPAGQVHELWLIAPGGNPVSLGLLQDATVAIPCPTPPAGWVLAVSMEPAGGAPDGKPTGPVVMTGEVSI